MGNSWKDYINALTEKGHALKASIHGCQDGKMWAGCSEFDVSSDEVLEIVNGFADPTYLRREGISINGMKFTLTRVTEGKIMLGRDVSDGSGCVIYKCHTCIIICIHDGGTLSGGCYAVVERIGDFLCNKSI